MASSEATKLAIEDSVEIVRLRGEEGNGETFDPIL